MLNKKQTIETNFKIKATHPKTGKLSNGKIFLIKTYKKIKTKYGVVFEDKYLDWLDYCALTQYNCKEDIDNLIK